ncbi:hypothetical protein [Natronolimnobius baerhuensis]|uniref:Uncharacterized protein n=1 Tax=Natronolimnobius baerhuensis TaxID=253108 RepID=A0A202E8Q7_9EURY|nr:hypothetical protein [Natronolimnobius baerhuensis]OVE84666.1 hypothetical protein B2G88_09755 [Natronolimnobius baerhuensis]
MTEEHDHELTTELPGDEIAPDERSAQSPLEAIQSLEPGDIPSGTVPLAGGGLLLVSALRSVLRGQLRAIPKAIAGAALLKFGLGRRRTDSSEEETTFEPTSIEGVEGGSDDKETTDAAHAANQPEASRKSLDDDTVDSKDDDSSADIEFTDDVDEPRTKPETDADEADPRRNTAEESEDDEAVEIDVSDAAIAEENAEAAGPDPEQAQPSQTDSIEPEETPAEDASHKKIDPEDDSSADASDDEDADEDDET